jgi:hypothetical protein
LLEAVRRGRQRVERHRCANDREPLLSDGFVFAGDLFRAVADRAPGMGFAYVGIVAISTEEQPRQRMRPCGGGR